MFRFCLLDKQLDWMFLTACETEESIVYRWRRAQGSQWKRRPGIVHMIQIYDTYEAKDYEEFGVHRHGSHVNGVEKKTTRQNCGKKT